MTWTLLHWLWALATSTLSLGAAASLGRDAPAAACESCHRQQVDEWRQSRHAVAFTNGLYRAEWDGRRTAWCASCHAPLAADPRTVRDDDALALAGVGCMACHFRDGEMVSTRRAPASPHATRSDPAFASAAMCESCHEFRYPRMGADGMPVDYYELPMQDTVSEFRESAAASGGGGCLGCHGAASSAGHLFPGSHDADTLRSALLMDLCRDGEELRVGVSNVGAAHSVPTGGVNRHMVLRVWRSSEPALVHEDFIGRKFEAQADGGKRLTVDTRIAAGASQEHRVDLRELGGDGAEAVNIELRYIYPSEEFAELAEGTRRFESVERRRTLAAEVPSCDGER